MKVEPVILQGPLVRLEPMQLTHVEALTRVGLDPDLWRWIPTLIRTADDMRDYVIKALDELVRGVSLPFVIVDQASGQAIGSTRYGNIDTTHRRLEIGWTWLATAF